MSVFFSLALIALIIMAGLVVDGGARFVAQRTAQSAASDAARTATDVGATSRISGYQNPYSAQAAGERVLRERGVEGRVVVQQDGAVQVTTQVTKKTVFLSLIGIDQVQGRGYSTSFLIRPQR